MKRFMRSGLAALLMLGALACEEKTDRTDTGGVQLRVTDITGFPTTVSVNRPATPGGTVLNCSTRTQSQCFVVVDSVTLSSIVISGQTLSDISTVQIKSYEVTYSRRQPGTRTPPRLVRGLGSVVSPNGTVAFTNLPLLGPEQLLSVPLADLLIENGSFDTETRGTIVTLDLQLSFFGEFLNGRAIRSEPIGFTLSLVP